MNILEDFIKKILIYSDMDERLGAVRCPSEWGNTIKDFSNIQFEIGNKIHISVLSHTLRKYSTVRLNQLLHIMLSLFKQVIIWINILILTNSTQLHEN